VVELSKDLSFDNCRGVTPQLLRIDFGDRSPNSAKEIKNDIYVPKKLGYRIDSTMLPVSSEISLQITDEKRWNITIRLEYPDGMAVGCRCYRASECTQEEWMDFCSGNSSNLRDFLFRDGSGFILGVGEESVAIDVRFRDETFLSKLKKVFNQAKKQGCRFYEHHSRPKETRKRKRDE
jgi:hypothetical protein